MIKEIWENIERNVQKPQVPELEIRQGLSELRKEIKENRKKEEIDLLIDFDKEGILVELLSSKDAKTRKNTALLMGDLGRQTFLQPLFEAYQNEEQRFIKSSYLSAISKMDYREYLAQLKDMLENLSGEPLTAENKKHVEEEMRVLSDMIVGMEGMKPHKFTGYWEPSEIILLTNREHRETTAKQIEGDTVQEFSAGLKLTTSQLKKILSIRTYQELLFAVEGMKVLESDAMAAAKQIAESKLLEFLQKRHQGNTPFYFRVECKSKMPLDKKSLFVKKLSAELERLTERNLINSTSNYEFEIRFIENKEDKYNVLVKLNTIPDTRFSYRKESIAVSIKPADAALLVQLAKNYMKEGARVLDPFCGVATMLIERQKAVQANTSYGIDILGDAIAKAKINTEAAGQIIHFINKDFFDFEHEYRFDEIFTNMPFAIGRKTEDEIHEIYEHFFDCAGSFLEKEGTIILYSHHKMFVKRLAAEKKYVVLKEMEIDSKKGTYLFILK